MKFIIYKAAYYNTDFIARVFPYQFEKNDHGWGTVVYVSDSSGVNWLRLTLNVDEERAKEFCHLLILELLDPKEDLINLDQMVATFLSELENES